MADSHDTLARFAQLEDIANRNQDKKGAPQYYQEQRMQPGKPITAIPEGVI